MRAVIPVAGVLAALLCPAALSAADLGGSFGVACGAETNAYHAKLFPALHEAGVSTVRLFPEWQTLEPERGRFTWDASGALLESARRSRIEIFGVFCYLAPWASSAPADADLGSRMRIFPIKDIEYWREYVAATVARYRSEVTYWEVYNEFNAPAFARNATPKDYAGLIRNAYEVAKRANPNCRIGIGCADVDLSFLEQVITQGASGCFDFVNVHPYSLLSAAMDGREPTFLQMTANLRKMLHKTGQRADIRLWVSEIGVAATEQPEPEQRQAEAIAKAYVLCLAQGIERVFWFEGRGPAYGPGGEFGILREDWSQRPSFVALNTMTRLLGTRPARLGWLNPSGQSYGFVFQGTSGPVLALWAASDKGDSVPMSGDAVVTDLTGVSTTVRAASALALTRTPVFVTGLPAATVAQARANHDKPFPWLKDYSKAETVSCTLGAANVESGLAQLEWGDGRMVVGLVDGDNVRRTDRAKGMYYVYFDVDDSYASLGDKDLEIRITARRTDPAKDAGCNLTYESATGYKGQGAWWSVPAGDGWHQHTFTIHDANFANNWGWNFRLEAIGSPSDLWIRSVSVKRLGPKA